jgi:hypothetical protein
MPTLTGINADEVKVNCAFSITYFVNIHPHILNSLKLFLLRLRNQWEIITLEEKNKTDKKMAVSPNRYSHCLLKIFFYRIIGKVPLGL